MPLILKLSDLPYYIKIFSHSAVSSFWRSILSYIFWFFSICSSSFLFTIFISPFSLSFYWCYSKSSPSNTSILFSTDLNSSLLDRCIICLISSFKFPLSFVILLTFSRFFSSIWVSWSWFFPFFHCNRIYFHVYSLPYFFASFFFIGGVFTLVSNSLTLLILSLMLLFVWLFIFTLRCPPYIF